MECTRSGARLAHSLQLREARPRAQTALEESGPAASAPSPEADGRVCSQRPRAWSEPDPAGCRGKGFQVEKAKRLCPAAPWCFLSPLQIINPSHMWESQPVRKLSLFLPSESRSLSLDGWGEPPCAVDAGNRQEPSVEEGASGDVPRVQWLRLHSQWRRLGQETGSHVPQRKPSVAK